jgi:molecular chaperone IbpA
MPQLGPANQRPSAMSEGLLHRFTEDEMRNLDFAPLYRATVGFDRIADLMDRVLTTDVALPTYPPYNIEKIDDQTYRISVAVAGFSPDELTVEVKEGTLVVAARKVDDEAQRRFLHRGIATRAFERRFALADHVRVTGALHELGMLHIDLVRETPEALKPRRIEITRADKTQSQALDAQRNLTNLPELTET